MTDRARTDYELLLFWLTFVGLLVFALFVAWHEGLLRLLLHSDKSKISVLIGLLYLVGFLHCGRRVLYVARQSRLTEDFAGRLERDGPAGARSLPRDTLGGAYVHDALRGAGTERDDNGARGNLPEIYAGRVKGPNELGWFLADVMLKLGLLGTIIGFILMLGSVAETSSLDANTMQKILRQMSVGMGTALYTTLAGLLASVTLAAQFQLLERGADRLLARIVHLAEVEILPDAGQH